MFMLFLFLLLTSVHATTGEITVASLDEQRLQALKKRLDFDDLVGGTDTFDRLALKETFEQTPTTIPPFFHYIWVGGPLYEEYWSSITRLAMLFKKSHSAARVVVWVDDLKNLEFLKVKQTEGGFFVKRNHSLSMYKPLLDVRNVDELNVNKPDFFTKEQHAEYWNIINSERHGLRNLGAVSDMVRVDVLRQYGGVYLDTDMTPMFFNIDSLPPSLFRVPLNFQIIDRSNCLIISTPYHPLLKAMMRHVLISYVDNFLQIQEKRRTDRPLKSVADRKINKRFSLTIKISGPGAFYSLLIG